jgi:hypothetical protein
MATTRNQDLQASITQTKESIQQVTVDLASTNSRIAKFETQVQQQFNAMDAKFMGEFSTLQFAVNQLLNCPQGPSSLEQPSPLDGVDSSHSMIFQSNSFHYDPCPPRVEFNKFDSSNPTGWVTQMENYFSLHGITDELAKIRYVVLYMDIERWKWWQWRKNARQGYVAWT